MAAQTGGPGEADSAAATDAELARRLDRLSLDLAVEQREREAAARPQRSGGDYGAAFRLASEFVAGVLVGAALGWGLDRVAGTSPWGLIGLLLLGFLAGVLNVIRTAGRMSGASSSGRGDPRPGGQP